MAKNQSAQPQTSEMTAMIFRFKGNDATLQRGFDTIAAAIEGLVPPGRTYAATVSRVRELPALPAEQSPDDARSQDSSEPIDIGTPSFSKSPRVIKSPQVLDIDLTSGEVPLKAFLSGYSGDEVAKRYLLVAFWLKTYRSVPDVSMDHIHTGFRHMAWHTPKDAAQPLRGMKFNGWFHKGEMRGFYKLNHVGENEVSRILEGKG
jgi:hypothetical protein